MSIVMLLLLFLISLFFRIYGFFQNYPFWVDEFSTAKNARYILDYGFDILRNSNIAFEIRTITANFLVALFFKIGGQTESMARLPFIIIGSLLPIAVYILAKRLFNNATAICSSLLTIFSYYLITWSRQARAYALLQLLVLITIIQYLKIIDAHPRKNKFGYFFYLLIFFFTIILGIFTHTIFYILILSIAVHFAIFKNSELGKFFNSFLKLFFVSASLLFMLFVPIRLGVFSFFKSSFFGANNLWYYHSFLWREYGLISFLAIGGLIIALFEKTKKISLILIYLTFHLIFVAFIWAHYMTKYILPIFPLFLIAASYCIVKLTELIIEQKAKSRTAWLKRLKVFVPFFITLFIVINGDKFTIKPKSYYSLNKHFREIANIDYQQIYSIIKKKDNLKKVETAIVETWPDRAKWYLGNGYKNLYYFKWQNEPGRVSGHYKITEFILNKEGEKITGGKEPLKYIGELSDLKKAMQKHPRGFIFIDDSSLPRDVIDYAENYLKKELYLDHYPLDDNPYSIWPATLYSWGIN